MSSTLFDIGDRPRFTATFRNEAGSLTDPSTVIFLWRTAAGVETTYTNGVAPEVTRSSLGVFVFTPPTIAVAGAHACRVKSTSITTAAELAVGVRASKFATP